jgi:hypothetical protein
VTAAETVLCSGHSCVWCWPCGALTQPHCTAVAAAAGAAGGVDFGGWPSLEASMTARRCHRLRAASGFHDLPAACALPLGSPSDAASGSSFCLSADAREGPGPPKERVGRSAAVTTKSADSNNDSNTGGCRQPRAIGCVGLTQSQTPTNGAELRKQSLKTGVSTTPKRSQPCAVRARSKSILTSSLSLRAPKNAE